MLFGIALPASNIRTVGRYMEMHHAKKTHQMFTDKDAFKYGLATLAQAQAISSLHTRAYITSPVAKTQARVGRTLVEAFDPADCRSLKRQ